MTKDYFTPVDFEAAFPEPKEPRADMPKVPDTRIVIGVANAINTITVELQAIRSGQSKLHPTAVQFNESKTPFCIALSQLPAQPTIIDALRLVALAKQDFNERFANFVLAEFKNVFEEK